MAEGIEIIPCGNGGGGGHSALQTIFTATTDASCSMHVNNGNRCAGNFKRTTLSKRLHSSLHSIYTQRDLSWNRGSLIRGNNRREEDSICDYDVCHCALERNRFRRRYAQQFPFLRRYESKPAIMIYDSGCRIRPSFGICHGLE